MKLGDDSILPPRFDGRRHGLRIYVSILELMLTTLALDQKDPRPLQPVSHRN